MFLSNQIAGHLQYFMKKMCHKVNFLYADKVFYKFLLPFLVSVVSHTQIASRTTEILEGSFWRRTRWIAFIFDMYKDFHSAILQFSQLINFQGKHQSLLQGDTIVFGGSDQICPDNQINCRILMSIIF